MTIRRRDDLSLIHIRVTSSYPERYNEEIPTHKNKYMNTHVIDRRFIGVLGAALFGVLLLTLPPVVSAHSGSHAETTAGALVDSTCMAEAVDVREEALIDAWEDLNTSVVSALRERKSALHAAWELSVVKERAVALVKAWKEWKADKKAAHAEFRKDRKAAWETFKKTARDECKVKVPKEEALEKTEKDSVSI